MNISILGCGWLGLPLAKTLIEEKFTIKGSTTSRDKIIQLQQEKITPYLIQLFAQGVQGDLTSFLSHSDTLIISIPPGLRKDPETDFKGKIEMLLKYIRKSDIKNVLFISSTAVYKDSSLFPVYEENSSANGTTKAAVEMIGVEKLMTKNRAFRSTILRFGGLIGADRHPVTYLSGRIGIVNPDAPVNLIHKEDAIEIIKNIIKKEAWDTVFNAAFPEHPAKETYYGKKAKEMRLAVPQFDHKTPSKGKIISSERLEEILQFKFQYKI